MDDKLKNIIDFCQEYDMLPKYGSVLVCVSGGADSMCLLHLMASLSDTMGFSVIAAHFNHKLRGEESDGDEAFVSDWCRKMGVPLYIGSGDVKAVAEKSGAGIEETARSMRYSFFYDTAEKSGASKIATAHTADDNLETVLMRIARGTGLLGLGGIPPVRDNIIRPLLCLTRKDIESYNLKHGVSHREDSSNFSDDYARNRIRHHVVPVLRDLNPAVGRACADMTALLRRDERFIQSMAQDFVSDNLSDNSLPAALLCELPEPVATRVVRLCCGDGISYGHVKSVLELAGSGSPSGRLSLPGLTVRRQYDRLVFSEAEVKTFEPRELPTDGVLTIEELGLRFTAATILSMCEIYKSLTTFLFKSDSICGKITVRPRNTGDSIRLSEKSGAKSLKRLFIDKKIPAHARAAVPVICDELGPVAIPGIGCDVRVRPSPGDSVLKVKVEEISDL
ncbi:MAG: tRNA lysidine(34) synthetase TilS [Oscillospiraceae bacterium]